MIKIRRADDRGHADHGWLDTFHTFSFADYHDPDFMGYRSLRVINEDRVAPAQGFGTHGHRDMEICTWVLGGSLAHRDNMGNGSAIRPGELQYMSAGTGVLHSEMNPSDRESVHLLQIWIVPVAPGGAPRYAQKDFGIALAKGGLVLLASDDGADGSIQIKADASIRGARLGAGRSVEHALKNGRGAWVQVARGVVDVNGRQLEAGDGASVDGERAVKITAQKDAEFLLFDLG